MNATTIKRIVFSAALVILGVLLGRFSADYDVRIQSRHTNEDFSQFMDRMHKDEVGEATFGAAGELQYVTRTSQIFETTLPPGTAQWLTKSLLERGVKVKATAAR